MDDDYTNEPTSVRVWKDGDEWFIDGTDDNGRYTEACWSYDTYAEAIANVADFIRLAPEYGITFRWNTKRRRVIRWTNKEVS